MLSPFLSLSKKEKKRGPGARNCFVFAIWGGLSEMWQSSYIKEIEKNAHFKLSSGNVYSLRHRGDGNSDANCFEIFTWFMAAFWVELRIAKLAFSECVCLVIVMRGLAVFGSRAIQIGELLYRTNPSTHERVTDSGIKQGLDGFRLFASCIGLKALVWLSVRTQAQ